MKNRGYWLILFFLLHIFSSCDDYVPAIFYFDVNKLVLSEKKEDEYIELIILDGYDYDNKIIYSKSFCNENQMLEVFSFDTIFVHFDEDDVELNYYVLDINMGSIPDGNIVEVGYMKVTDSLSGIVEGECFRY